MKNSGFFLSLAWENIRRNRAIYGPYLLAGAVCSGLIYTLNAISEQLSSGDVRWAAYLSSSVNFCVWFCGLLVLLILFYVNSFVMKRRKRELGLYAVLGMEKRHIAAILFWEVLISGAASLICGIAGGLVFSQVMFRILLFFTKLSQPFSFLAAPGAMLRTAAWIGIVFLLLLVYDLLVLAKTDPVSLIHSDSIGEREPKTRWVLTLSGLLTLALGYGIVFWVNSPSDALVAFFPAVVLVILATFLLFTAGSIALLKHLRKKKRFYYRPENFISVSGLLYRMKQNAVGLASICILSTCVLVTLSTTVCINIGEEDALRERYPRAAHLVLSGSGTENTAAQDAVRTLAEQSGVTLDNAQAFTSAAIYTQREGDAIPLKSQFTGTYLRIVPVSDFEAAGGQTVPLEPGEILLYQDGGVPAGDSLTITGETFRIREKVIAPELLRGGSGVGESFVAIVTEEDFSVLSSAWEQGLGENLVRYDWYFDVGGEQPARETFLAGLRDAADVSGTLRTLEDRDGMRSEFYALNGSLLFIGIFFVVLFLLATVLIIYYKQVTEGYDDCQRFRIMSEVGLSREESRRAIRRQVLLMFFLPLGGAVIHIAAAFHVLCEMMTLFQLYDTALFLICTAGSVILFGLFYFAVYRLTAKTYLRIVAQG